MLYVYCVYDNGNIFLNKLLKQTVLLQPAGCDIAETIRLRKVGGSNMCTDQQPLFLSRQRRPQLTKNIMKELLILLFFNKYYG